MWLIKLIILILFKIHLPREGIGIITRRYEGRATDGRNWTDLYYQMAGKHSSEITGKCRIYLFSPKFFQPHDGRQTVVWVSPVIAEITAYLLLEDTEIGEADLSL